ncbi:hypothetical protein D1007_11635 [Hordeum vulgare]|nr:hypothetical protein D1007_11635 [Hordeum vulgare]
MCTRKKVDQSEDKSIELFATKVEPPWAEIDLNRVVSSPMTERTSVSFVVQRIMIDTSNAYIQPPTSKESEVELHAPNACSQPTTSQANEVDVIASEEVIQKDGDGYVDGDFDEVDEGFHGIEVGDLDAYVAQKEMDRDLPFSLAHKVIVDAGMRKTTIEPTPCPDPDEPRDEEEGENAYLKKGVKFPTLAAVKVWLSDFAIWNHMPFYIEHSNINLRFTVKYEKGDEGCPWKVRARKLEETGEWVLRSCVPTHFCRRPKKRDRTTHRQLMSEYPRYKFMRDIAVGPTVKVRHVFIRFDDEVAVCQPRGHAKEVAGERVGQDQAREEERDHREKDKKENKKREEEKKHKEKEARQEERARKVARSRDAQAEDEARNKKGKWPRTTQ